ncbi:MAG TPA: ATP-binding protein [Acidimicrobiia bacterium]|nr:ATP-binding protein [Acidimicrobiia bacterium]
MAQQQGDAPYVFDRFWRAGSARGTPGSGLGLATVRQVADQHHATVTVETPPTAAPACACASRSYCARRERSASASGSTKGWPSTSTVTRWSTPVNRNGDR